MELKLEKDKLKKDDILRIKVNVKNEGNRAGEEVVQLYIRDLVGCCVRPVKELKAFEKIWLEPGEIKQVDM